MTQVDDELIDRALEESHVPIPKLDVEVLWQARLPNETLILLRVPSEQ